MKGRGSDDGAGQSAGWGWDYPGRENPRHRRRWAKTQQAMLQLDFNSIWEESPRVTEAPAAADAPASRGEGPSASRRRQIGNRKGLPHAKI